MEEVRLIRMGDSLILLLSKFRLAPNPVFSWWVWLLSPISSVLTETLLDLPFCLGEGVEPPRGVMVAVVVGGGGEGEGGKMGSGVQSAICSEILATQRLFELCVRKMMTTPFRGPLGE